MVSHRRLCNVWRYVQLAQNFGGACFCTRDAEKPIAYTDPLAHVYFSMRFTNASPFPISPVSLDFNMIDILSNPFALSESFIASRI